jgi:hypothetical protein
MLSVASVTMNAGILVKATARPLNTPTAMPMAAATRMPRATWWLPIACAPSTPDSAMTEPCDRSMPAVTITNVWPMARVAITATLSKIVTMLPLDRKCGDRNEKITTSTIRAAATSEEFSSLSRAARRVLLAGASRASIAVLVMAYHLYACRRG